MTGPEHDEEFEQYLRQRTALPNGLAKADRSEPPPELDRIVLAQAREAIRTSKPSPLSRSKRWALPFGLAATVIIAFSVFLHMRENEQPSQVLVAASPVRTVNKLQAAAKRAPLSPAYTRAPQEAKSEKLASAPVRSNAPPALQRLEARSLAKRTVLPPADWRAKIAKLRADGKSAEADREQAEFVKTYPAESPIDAPSE